MRDKIPGYIQAEAQFIRDAVQGLVSLPLVDLHDHVLMLVGVPRTCDPHVDYDRATQILLVGREVRGTKNDGVGCVFRVHTRDGLITAVLFVGALHYLHGHNIAAVHRDGGAATCLCGYETPTTYNRIQQVARVSHRSHKRSAYIGKMPIDPYRVYIHPSGIPFQMPQYATPLGWLTERAGDKEFDHA